MPDEQQQKSMLHMRCQMEVFCPRCMRPLTPLTAVLIQQYQNGMQASSAICCWECFDNYAAPELQKSGVDPKTAMSKLDDGYVLISDGRRLFAVEQLKASGEDPTAGQAGAGQ